MLFRSIFILKNQGEIIHQEKKCIVHEIQYICTSKIINLHNIMIYYWNQALYTSLQKTFPYLYFYNRNCNPEIESSLNFHIFFNIGEITHQEKQNLYFTTNIVQFRLFYQISLKLNIYFKHMYNYASIISKLSTYKSTYIHFI